MARTNSLAFALLILTLVGQCCGQYVGYYNKRCGSINVEEVVYNVVKKHYIEEVDTIADLIRLQFHDCVVRGCDASVLLEGSYSEKTSEPDSTVAGYDIIEEAKVALDKYCPGVVSCADIIVLAARSALHLGGVEWYNVETGRKDGRVSLSQEAVRDLPGPNIPIPKAIELFKYMGLNTEEFVVLLGCHTVGTAHCNHFQYRLYNYHGTGKPDPSMNYYFLAKLKKVCPKYYVADNEAFLDQTPGSEFVFDNAYYKRLMEGKGLLEIDQQLATHSATKEIVKKLATDPKLFVSKIGPAMRKMGLYGVKYTGEVRLGTCKKVRHY